MRSLRSLLTGIGISAMGPVYLGLAAYTARQAPWPRSTALAVSSILAVLALAGFVLGASCWVLRAKGWAEEVLHVPPEAARQLRRAILLLTSAAVLFLLPERLLSLGLLAPGGRPVSAPSLCRLLELCFELVALVVAFRLTRSKSPLVEWGLQFPDRFGWWNRHRRLVSWAVLALFGTLNAIDAYGYSFTARRLEIGACQLVLVAALCWVLRRLIVQAIDHHAWRWVRLNQARAEAEGTDESGHPHDLAGRLRRLTAYLVPVIGVFTCAWLWDFDLALFRSLGEQTLIPAGKEIPALLLGDVALAVFFIALTSVAWKHLSTFFALAVFPRMPDDPGIRFAVLTLSRYAVLGIGLMAGLSSVHLGPAQIGMVLAALGVGLGFGLQEIVSNFVCGIILLIERPIRVGDIVTVSGMSGKVDRINIRATTIINGENQSIIVPNRAFITGDLINSTLKDKVVRASIRVKVAPGNDPDRVTDLLLNIAREDADVLRNPLPASLMEDFSDSALVFVLHVHVPDPSLGGRVRHRLMTQVQKQFRDAGIVIPMPTHELHVKTSDWVQRDGHDLAEAVLRSDPARDQPPAPHWAQRAEAVEDEDCVRGVDE